MRDIGLRWGVPRTQNLQCGPKWSPGIPKTSQWSPKRAPKTPQSGPKASSRHPNAAPGAPKCVSRLPQATQWHPKESQRAMEASKNALAFQSEFKGSLYTQNSQSIAPAAIMLLHRGTLGILYLCHLGICICMSQSHSIPIYIEPRRST